MLLVLVSFSAMADVATPGKAITYVRSTGEHVPATIVGPSTHELCSIMRKAIFPNGLKLSQLGDVDFLEHRAANAKPDSDSDSDHSGGTDSDSDLLTSDDSSSCSGENDEVQIVWAKAGHGIWGLGHVFEGKLYFTKDIVDDSFVPRNRKPNLIPKLEAKPSPKPAPKGKHVQLFKMRRKVGKGFCSTARDAPDR